MSRFGFFVLAAFFEIAGCYAYWAWLRQHRPAWVALVGLACLVLFALTLTRVDAAFAGRAYAAYGGVYIAASLVWLAVVEGVRPDRWDIAGAALALMGAGLIIGGPRP